ncbi:MAG: class A beta-lactamase-related serine hydrolase [Clostridia bacterium]|nr:class A beta-lactamase-related serine hydrolase [Clostridia bacterium]
MALEQLLEKCILEKEYPGVAVCIRGPSGVIFEKGFGYRSIKRQLKVDGNTVFGIASMSKSFVTLACCILQTEGKLSLEDPISKYFPDLHLPGLPDESVTLKLIGMHRAGIPPMEPLEWSIAMNSVECHTDTHWDLVKSAPNKMDKIEQIIEYLSEGKYGSLGSPGEYMSYSNEGYALLSYVVDQASGTSLEDFLTERIFKPLGMNRSILDLDCSEAKILAGDDNVTSLFDKNEENGLIEDDNWSILPPFRGCACVKSTALDITKYYKMLSDKGMFEGKQVIPAEAIELLIGREYPLREEPFYCQGLRKSLIAGKLVCDHGGELHGVSTHGGFIEGGYSAAVLCNGSELDMESLQWICFNYILGLPLETEHHWALSSDKEFSRPDMLLGEYIGHEGIPTHCNISIEDGKLVCEYRDKRKDLRYCFSTVFAVYDDETKVRESTFRFHIRDGKAWGVNCGSRIYQRLSSFE